MLRIGFIRYATCPKIVLSPHVLHVVAIPTRRSQGTVGAHINVPIVGHVQAIEIFAFVFLPEDVIGVEDETTATLFPFQFDFVFEEVR